MFNCKLTSLLKLILCLSCLSFLKVELFRWHKCKVILVTRYVHLGLAYNFCKAFFFAQRLETQLSKLNLSDNLMKSPVVRKMSDATRGLKIRFNEVVKQDFVKVTRSF